MKIAIISFTEAGENLARKLEKKCKKIDLFINNKLDSGVKGLMKNIWYSYDALVFISSTGIALRYINPFIEDKYKDPAVLVIDDGAKFVISLLSGHLGGANKLTRKLADQLGSQAVITTASDNRGFRSLDLFCQDQGYLMEDREAITRLSALMVNGKNLGFYSIYEAQPDYPGLYRLESLDNLPKGLEGLIIVSPRRMKLDSELPTAWLRPRIINLGIGCRRDVSGARIIQAIEKLLEQESLSPLSIRSLASVEIKKDEKGILEAADYFSASLSFFTLDEIAKVDHLFEKSDFVKKTLGVYSVSEPSAYLLGGSLLRRKVRMDGITLSLSMED